MSTTITRITADDVVAMDTEGFFALHRDCLPWAALEPDDETWYVYATKTEAGERLYVPSGRLLQAAVGDPRYVVEIGGRDVYLAPDRLDAYSAAWARDYRERYA